MASPAIIAVRAGVRVILPMAGVAILRRRLQIYNCARIEVAVCATCFCMFPDQLKRKGIVIEVIAITVHAVMAGKALRPEGEGMCLGEGNVHLTVTGLAGVGSEGGHILRMTIRADKRFLLRCELVTGQ